MALSAPGANAQLVELAGVYQEHKPDAISDMAHRRFLSNHVHKHNYVDTQQYVITGRTINASNKYEYDLDQFDHLSAALVVCIRATGAGNTLGTSQDYATLIDG